LIKENSIIVSRAGSSTLFEILGLEKASILIPSSFVSDNHQYYNAKYLEEKKQALLLLEEDASVNKLKELIVSLNESFKLKNNIIVNIKKDEYLSSLNKFIFEIEDIL
jgi:UDP-N-acetylglucosamine--N-acetylmuramyl-(pentapeptide) pyrophosphoryl-undecaprenol N-acetylglucosamine transferase